MKTISCNVILDILPLCIDQAVSKDTEQLVKEHLKSCSACRAEAEQMKKALVLPEDNEVRAEEARILEQSICGLEKRVRSRLLLFAAAFDLLLNIAMPFFVKWIHDVYIKVQSVERYEGLEGVMSTEMLSAQWDLAAISGYCLFFGAADLFYMIGSKRRKIMKISEPLIILSYVLKAAALVVFVIVEIFI